MVRLRCDVFVCLPLLTLGACVFMYMCARSHTSVHSYGFVHACMHACVQARSTHTLRHCGCGRLFRKAPTRLCFRLFREPHVMRACQSRGAQQ